mgnify:CR=1 FL=1
MTAKNDTLIDFLKTRRSTPVLQLAAPGPNRGEIEEMLTIASRVPDHGKLAPWRFIVFEGDGRANFGQVLAKIFAAANPNATPDQIDAEASRFTRAPLVIAVISHVVENHKIPEWEQVLSAGAACQNMLIAASAMGFGAAAKTSSCDRSLSTTASTW